VRIAKRNRGARGFTLIELLVAMGLFAVIAGAALSLFSGNLPVYVAQQNQAGLNIAIRNAMAQMQNDIVNAGSGYYVGTNVPDWPVGVTIQNNVSTSACNTPATYTYGPNCFDQINVITVDKNTPPAHPTDSTLGSASTNCTTSTIGHTSMYVFSTAGTSQILATALKNDYQVGDELLLVDGQNAVITTIKISAASVVNVGGTYGVLLTYAANTTPNSGTSPTTGSNTAANDPLGIDTYYNSKLISSGWTFCANDWLLRLAPVEYFVNTSTATNPQLIRRVISGTTNTDTTIAEQMVGFKVGADLYNNSDDCPIAYYYNAAVYPATGGT
jgi:prepilin-type N-terminal cleavage/methylation domain-containing protein